jgi:hypothetical protein
MTHFVYFGYGSNMLTERLTARCESARPLGAASLANHTIEFSKRSADNSGKATIVASAGAVVHGVMFQIPIAERDLLDKAEGLGYGYNRLDDVEIVCARTTSVMTASTYIALPNQIDPSLKPYDWYHALVVAGAEQHGLPPSHVDVLRSVEYHPDRNLSRTGRLQALDALDSANYPHGLPYPNRAAKRWRPF